MSMEATSGKNPINHIGKIYNLLSTQIARECVTKVDGIEEMYVRLFPRSENPSISPWSQVFRCCQKSGIALKDINSDIEAIVNDHWQT